VSLVMLMLELATLAEPVVSKRLGQISHPFGPGSNSARRCIPNSSPGHFAVLAKAAKLRPVRLHDLRHGQSSLMRAWRAPSGRGRRPPREKAQVKTGAPPGTRTPNPRIKRQRRSIWPAATWC